MRLLLMRTTLALAGLFLLFVPFERGLLAQGARSELPSGEMGGSRPDVDLLLVLAVDISRSVDERKFRLQRDGYAAALVNPRVMAAIRSGLNGRIAIAFIEWSGVSEQTIVADWTAIGSPEEAETL